MDIGLVKKVDIDHEMQQSYLDYAMSVIVSRALPDARDGSETGSTAAFYAMYDMGIRPDSAYKKSARIVGEVLGKYHPHGDQAVYEAMARMAQDFSMRYPIGGWTGQLWQRGWRSAGCDAVYRSAHHTFCIGFDQPIRPQYSRF